MGSIMHMGMSSPLFQRGGGVETENQKKGCVWHLGCGLHTGGYGVDLSKFRWDPSSRKIRQTTWCILFVDATTSPRVNTVTKTANTRTLLLENVNASHYEGV